MRGLGSGEIDTPPRSNTTKKDASMPYKLLYIFFGLVVVIGIELRNGNTVPEAMTTGGGIGFHCNLHLPHDFPRSIRADYG